MIAALIDRLRSAPNHIVSKPTEINIKLSSPDICRRSSSRRRSSLTPSPRNMSSAYSNLITQNKLNLLAPTNAINTKPKSPITIKHFQKSHKYKHNIRSNSNSSIKELCKTQSNNCHYFSNKNVSIIHKSIQPNISLPPQSQSKFKGIIKIFNLKQKN